MPGIGDGVLGDGVLGESISSVTVDCGTPSALVFTVREGTVGINQSISFGAGTSELTLTANAVTVSISGSVSFAASVIDELVLTVNAASVEIAGVINVNYTTNIIELTLLSKTPAYVGELVVVGLMSAGFTVTQPSMGFSVAQPSMSMTVH